MDFNTKRLLTKALVLIGAQDKLLMSYRIGSQPADSTLDAVAEREAICHAIRSALQLSDKDST